MVNIKVAERVEDAGVYRLKLSELVLDAATATDISLNLSVADIQSYERLGNDLQITLVDGSVLPLSDFFVPNEDGKKNRLFLSESEYIEYVDLSNFDSSGVLGVTQAASTPVDAVAFNSGIIFGAPSALVGGTSFAGPAAFLGSSAAISAGGIAATADGDPSEGVRQQQL